MTSAGSQKLASRLQDYQDWANDLASSIESYIHWIESQSEIIDLEEFRLYELLDELRSNRLVVAIVGEFSRGKSELVNAIFFADQGRRLLPSTPGRTTMCTTELLYDDNDPPCIKLLPIATRKTNYTIAELKKLPENWTQLPLDLASPEQVTETLGELARSCDVNPEEAERMGLYISQEEDFLTVPMWRHAIINYPHPILQQGLIILDTPGLNAQGIEQELTLRILPNAHIVLFVLAADTGVTQSDKEIWDRNIGGAHTSKQGGQIVVLNKIDMLWDELLDDLTIEKAIQKQVEATASMLGIGKDLVFPVSARKGLISRIRNDRELMEKCGLDALEKHLGNDLVSNKKQLILRRVSNEIGDMINSSRLMIEQQKEQYLKEVNELEVLQNQSAGTLALMTERVKKQRDLYQLEVESFQTTRNMLNNQVKDILYLLRIGNFDGLVADSREGMRKSWTTKGLRKNMSSLFKGASEIVSEVEEKTEALRMLAKKIYLLFHQKHGLPMLKPEPFKAASFFDQFRILREEVDNYQNSAGMLLSEQHFVIKKFFIQLVSRARFIYQTLYTAVKQWARSILGPLYQQIGYHHEMIERRLFNLQQLQQDRRQVNQRIAETRTQLTIVSEHLDSFNRMLKLLEPEPTGHSNKITPSTAESTPILH
ncbi:MAG TPA: hypothetical protein ENI62_11835 [Gammaproteobacteria bacterium]|nr:hypothetical protein [Gammaproteobacteria bacterium]